MAPSTTPPPLAYQLFFLYIEPVATLAGAFWSQFKQYDYMQMTLQTTTTSLIGVTQTESIILTQLANLYFVFALNEAIVLRASFHRAVWRAFLFGLLVADFGHLYSVKSVGREVYWEFWKWNAMYWGNLGFVYVGAFMRSCFLLGVGLSDASGVKSKEL